MHRSSDTSTRGGPFEPASPIEDTAPGPHSKTGGENGEIQTTNEFKGLEDVCEEGEIRRNSLKRAGVQRNYW